MKKIMFNDMYGLTDAVLNGRKTMTRRVITVPDKWHGIEVYGFSHVKGEHTLTLTDGDDFIIEDPDTGEIGQILPTYKIGEEVAVAQSYKHLFLLMRQFPKIQNTFLGAIIKAHDLHPESIDDVSKLAGWSNKMFVRADLMPHRIRITNVRIERLQDISDEDCLREGIYETEHYSFGYPPSERQKTFHTKLYERYDAFSTPKNAFAALINKLSGRKAWDDNPWVFVYEFELVK